MTEGFHLHGHPRPPALASVNRTFEESALQHVPPFDVDLQTHTTASDGTCTPTRVVQMAAEKGIRVVGITDHDTVRGLAEAAAAGARAGVEVVPGMELHLLGYFIDPKDPGLNEVLEWVVAGWLAQRIGGK